MTQPQDSQVEMIVGAVGDVPIFQLTDQFTATSGREAATKIVEGLQKHVPHVVHDDCLVG